jgi:hypothetical protein
MSIKHSILSAASFMICMGAHSSAVCGEDSREESEKEAIRRIIMENYHEAHSRYDPALYEPILHNDWRLFHLDDEGKLHIINRDEYVASYDPSKRDPRLKRQTKIHYINVDGDIASAKLRIANQDFGYVDYFNLMKLEGRWWIVHKISRRE